MVRFGVSFDPKLLNLFDSYIKNNGYKNRSEALRDIARGVVAKQNTQKKHLIVSVTYDPRTKAYQKQLANLEDEYHCLVQSSLKHYLGHHDALLQLRIIGNTERVNSFLEKLNNI